MNIQQGIMTDDRHRPAYWEHTISARTAATGPTKGEELKRGDREAFETEATAVGSTGRGPWCKGEHGGGQGEAGGVRLLQWAWVSSWGKIRQPKLSEFQLFPLVV